MLKIIINQCSVLLFQTKLRLKWGSKRKAKKESCLWKGADLSAPSVKVFLKAFQILNNGTYSTLFRTHTFFLITISTPEHSLLANMCRHEIHTYIQQ